MEVLTAEDKKRVIEALHNAELLRKELAKAKRAGIDVAELEAKLREAELSLVNIKRVYIAEK